MSFRLKEAIYKIRCREPGCPFASEFSVKENIMGATEADVDSEALKIARNMGFIKHDALFGRKHPLANPEVNKVTASYERIGASPAPTAGTAPAFPAFPAAPAVPTRVFRRGEVIIRKGESAVTVCEVVRGVAMNEKLPELTYRPGATFGSAAIFSQKHRTTDIVAGEDGTTIAFYNIRELTKTNPSKARELYDEAMEDIFHVLEYLEDYSDGLERKVQKLEAAKAARPAGRKAPAAKKRPAGKKAPGTKKKPAPQKRPVARRKPPAKRKAAKRR